MKPILCSVFSLLALSLSCLGEVAPFLSPVSVADLRCEYSRNPLGVDSPNPLLSWKLESDHRSVRQTAYRILAASTPALLAADQGISGTAVRYDRMRPCRFPTGACFWSRLNGFSGKSVPGMKGISRRNGAHPLPGRWDCSRMVIGAVRNGSAGPSAASGVCRPRLRTLRRPHPRRPPEVGRNQPTRSS